MNPMKMVGMKDTAPEANLDVDFVVVYRFADTEQSTAAAKFQKLVEVLARAGLDTEVRQGEDHSILIFTKLSQDEYLHGEVYRSRMRDWLHGARSAAPDKATKESIAQEPLYPAERLRIIYQLITNPVEEGGAGITPQHGEWKNVESVFALHDRAFNKAWIKQMASTYILKPEDLDKIRDQFGEKVGFYFAFTQAYFVALVGIAAFGVSAWLILGSFSPIYAVVNGLLCISFIEYWKHQEEDLAFRWGVKGVSKIESKRVGFLPEEEVTDPITGEKLLLFSGTKRLQRQLLQVPFALVAASALGLIIAMCFGIEIFISEVYNGPGQGLLVFLPTIILSTTQPLTLGALTNLAERLSKFENYETDAEYEAAMTQKIFVLNFITSYLGIFLTAFVYVPFARVIVPYLDVFSLTVKPFADHPDQFKAPSPAVFKINPDRLKKQVIYFTVTAQIVNQVLEIVLPYLKRQGLIKYKQYKSDQASKRGGARVAADAYDTPEEAAFLKKVRQEAELGSYDVTTDFREMVIQYGYLTLFSVVWPLTPVSFLINNWVELRTDAVKICNEVQRPVPWRADSIGPWLDSLGFLTWLGSITTAAVVYLFSNGGLGPDGEPTSIRGWALMLCIFFSEHTYVVVKLGVAHLVSKLDSPGRQKERSERYVVRKRYLEESLGEQAALVQGKMRSAPKMGEQGAETRLSREEEARQSTLRTIVPAEEFWKRQRGWQEAAQVGVRLIQQEAAAESRKGR